MARGSLRIVPLLAVIAALAVLPILHHHSLVPHAADPHYWGAASLYCPLCAIGADGASMAPVAAAPVVVAYELPTCVPDVPVVDVAHPASSRAPPAAA